MSWTGLWAEKVLISFSVLDYGQHVSPHERVLQYPICMSQSLHDDRLLFFCARSPNCNLRWLLYLVLPQPHPKLAVAPKIARGQNTQSKRGPEPIRQKMFFL